MLESLLVQNTTEEERDRIVKESLGCGYSGCENCSSCGVFGAGDIYEMYLPYIRGEKELDDITREFNARYLRG